MSEFMFGVRKGKVTRAAIRRMEAAAEQNGCEVGIVTGNSGHCVCGHGCRVGACPIKTVWFAARNRGEPFNTQTASRVFATLAALEK